MSLILQGAAFKSGCGASVAPPPPPPPPVSGLLVSTGVWGAGFTLTMDYHPTIPGRAIVGGDVSGLFTTVDGGMTWNQGNTELVSDNDRRVPAAKWSRNPATPDLFWVISSGREIPGAAATIWKGTFNPVTNLIDSVEKWATIPNAGPGGGNITWDADTKASSGSSHPRNGKESLIGLDEVNGFIYIGGSDGIYRVRTTVKNSFAQVALAGKAVTSLQISPSDKTKLYCTVDYPYTATGVYRIDDIRGTGTIGASNTSADFDYPQSIDLVTHSGTEKLFVTTGRPTNAENKTKAVMHWTGGASLAYGWVDITGNLNDNSVRSGSKIAINKWTGLDAVMVSGSSVKLIVANGYDDSGGPGSRCGWTTWDFTGTPTWTMASSSNTSLAVGDASGEDWWLNEKQASMMFMNSGYDSLSPQIDPTSPTTRMMNSGRSGVWGSDTAIDGGKWHPKVNGLTVSMCNAVRGVGSWLVVADRDWSFLELPDEGRSQPFKPSLHQPPGTNAVAWSLHVHKPTGRVTVGIGDVDSNAEGNVEGGLFSSTNPFAATSGNWIDQAATGSGRPWGSRTTDGKDRIPRFTGVASNVIGGQVIYIGCVFNFSKVNLDSECGIWRKVGDEASGSWSQRNPAGFPSVFSGISKMSQANIAWQPGSNTVWIADPKNGLWQSQDAGLTWARRLSASTSSQGGNSSIPFVRSDPTRSGVYYATVGGKFYIITNGDSSTPIVTEKPVAGLNSARGVSVNPNSGHIYVANSADPRLFQSKNGGATFKEITTPSWRASMSIVTDMSIHDNNILYTTGYSGAFMWEGIE